MAESNWQFFISGRHRRLLRMWQSFFAGWGLVCLVGLIASPFVFKNMTWTILDAVDMNDVKKNNLSIENLRLNGTNKSGDEFHISAKTTTQKFAETDVIYVTKPIADIIRTTEEAKKVKDHIVSDTGRLVLSQNKLFLNGNVVITSSDGSSTKTNELEVNLK